MTMAETKYFELSSGTSPVLHLTSNSGLSALLSFKHHFTHNRRDQAIMDLADLSTSFKLALVMELVGGTFENAKHQ